MILHPKHQLLKWIGNKRRFLKDIHGHIPRHIRNYYEPFLGSGSVLVSVQSVNRYGSDIYRPLIELYHVVQCYPAELVKYYKEYERIVQDVGRSEAYHLVRDRYNAHPNGYDLFLVSRSCWGGVVRFTRSSGQISTPSGTHKLMPSTTIESTVMEWHSRLRGVEFAVSDYTHVVPDVRHGDFVYLDPPYRDSQTILYGAHHFDPDQLVQNVEYMSLKGANVMMSYGVRDQSVEWFNQTCVKGGVFKTIVKLDSSSSRLLRVSPSPTQGVSQLHTEYLLMTY